MKTYTPKEAAQAMLDGKTLTDGVCAYIWAGNGFSGKVRGGLSVFGLELIPDNLYDYEPEKPKVTLDGIERRLKKGKVKLKMVRPFALNSSIVSVIDLWDLTPVKYALDRIEAGAEGWAVEFMEGAE